MNVDRLLHALVLTGAASSLAACGDDKGDGETTGPVTGGGAGGQATTGGSGGGQSSAGASSGGAPSGGAPTGGAAGAGSCACEPPNASGWVFCNGACCWLTGVRNREPCCQ